MVIKKYDNIIDKYFEKLYKIVSTKVFHGKYDEIEKQTVELKEHSEESNL